MSSLAWMDPLPPIRRANMRVVACVYCDEPMAAPLFKHLALAEMTTSRSLLRNLYSHRVIRSFERRLR